MRQSFREYIQQSNSTRRFELLILDIVTVLKVQAVHVLDECVLPFAHGREPQMHAENDVRLGFCILIKEATEMYWSMKQT